MISNTVGPALCNTAALRQAAAARFNAAVQIQRRIQCDESCVWLLQHRLLLFFPSCKSA
ncbi:MAG: hypothetical protein ACTFAL_16965 [Candidatus Electronema sp. V4]|uniref:hypothetical protein n=1 Tax=Candidatus Electronema sp. V4 TaxID=3454756 RepID=UPI0040557546